MIAVLDILQSIPVLSFLPGVMLAMIALFPGHQFGIELGSILLLFTSQVWNMAFSFYSSLKSIPREMIEATRIYRYSAWQRFWQLELPFSAIGLIWNSIVSVASGWFVLIPCEMLTFGTHDFRLPGLGSYLYNAATASPVDKHALFWGMTMLDFDHRRHRPVDLAAADRLERQIQIRAGRIRLPRHFADPRPCCSRPSLLLRLPSRALDGVEESIYHRLAPRRRAAASSPSTTTSAQGGRLFPS